MEGQIKFHAMFTPSWERFQTVTLGAYVNQPGGTGSFRVEKDVTVEEARAFVAEIERAIEIVESDS